MRRVVCREFADPERFELVEEPTPEPGPGEVLVAVEAAAVSFVDGLIARGGYQLRPPLPFTPGSAIAGTTPDGRRVAALLTGFGGFTSHVVVPEELLVPVPDGVDAGVAASSMESHGTIAFAFRDRVTVRPGEWVVVLGASGGIGQAAVDHARAAGARVLAVASTPDKRAAALGAGAEIAVGYDALKDTIREQTGGGADVVIDPVGGDAAEAALRALAAGGRFCVLGFTSGAIPAPGERRAAAQPDRGRGGLGRLVAHRPRRLAGPGRGRAAPDRRRGAAPGPPADPVAGRRGDGDPRLRRALRGREAGAHALTAGAVINPDDGR